MEGVKGKEQMPASNVQFPAIASSSSSQMLKSSSPFTPDVLGCLQPLCRTDDDNGSGGGDKDKMNKTKKKQDYKTKFLGLPEFTVLGLLEFAVFMCALVVFITSLTAHKLSRCKILNLYTWRWCSLGFVILCGRLMAEWFVNILVFPMGKIILRNQKILFFVKGLRNSFQALIWSALVLLVWCLLITQGIKQPKETAKILKHVTRGLISCLVGTTLWMIKTLLLKKVAYSYLTTQFSDIGNQSKRDANFLSILSGSQRHNNQNNESSSILECWASIATISKQTKDDFRLLVVDEDHEPIHGVIRDAYWDALEIIKKVAKPNYKCIETEDLNKCFKNNNEDVRSFMKRFEGEADTGKIKISTLRNWMVNVYKDSLFLDCAVKDTKANIDQLNKLLSGILVALIIVIALLVMEIATTQLIILISSQIVVLAFIFGNACKDGFECVMFVFVRRLYSVGDCCVVEGVEMTVQRVRITKTVFLKNEKEIIVYPNSVLATKPLVIFHRTPPTNYSVEFVINLSTSAKKIKVLEDQVKAYIERKGNHWRSKHSIQYKEITDSNKLKMALDVSHSVYFLDDEEKSSQRSKLILELKNILVELEIQ